MDALRRGCQARHLAASAGTRAAGRWHPRAAIGQRAARVAPTTRAGCCARRGGCGTPMWPAQPAAGPACTVRERVGGGVRVVALVAAAMVVCGIAAGSEASHLCVLVCGVWVRARAPARSVAPQTPLSAAALCVGTMCADDDSVCGPPQGVCAACAAHAGGVGTAVAAIGASPLLCAATTLAAGTVAARIRMLRRINS